MKCSKDSGTRQQKQRNVGKVDAATLLIEANEKYSHGVDMTT